VTAPLAPSLSIDAIDHAERAAAFLLDRVRATRGHLWDEGAAALSLTASANLPASASWPPASTALGVFARRRVRGISPVVARSLLAWSRGERPVDLLTDLVSAHEILRRQANGRRCVSLLDDATARAHGDPRHLDGLSFAVHDLCHLEKFVAPEHHRGQVGFFRAVARALASAAVRAMEGTFDAIWRADRDYVIADMNGSAVFLFSVLKMRLAMAVRRRRAHQRGGAVPTAGGLDAEEREALAPVLSLLFGEMGLPQTLRTEALAVSARRDQPAHARRLLNYFEAEGTFS
jgi:PAS domain-containing protein